MIEKIEELKRRMDGRVHKQIREERQVKEKKDRRKNGWKGDTDSNYIMSGAEDRTRGQSQAVGGGEGGVNKEIQEIEGGCERVEVPLLLCFKGHSREILYHWLLLYTIQYECS